MPAYRIHRLKESAREQFRWAAHTIGVSIVRPKDYEASDTWIEGATPYAAWLSVRETAEVLRPGDILEANDGELRIYKYVGFEQAQWQVPDPPVVPSQEVMQ